MSQLTNENEFRVTRSRTKGLDTDLLAPSLVTEDPSKMTRESRFSLNTNTNMGSSGMNSGKLSSAAGTAIPLTQIIPSSSIASAVPTVSGSSSSSGTSARPQLRDVSRQFGISKLSQQNLLKKRPLGLLSNSHRHAKVEVSEESESDLKQSHQSQSSNQQDREGKENENENENKPNNFQNIDSLDRAPLEPIPHRLPQKRQATESSNNLVEKLHITNERDLLVENINGGISGVSTMSTSHSKYKKSKKTEYEWQDLDEEDFDDPLMVSEYVNEIFPYLHELEKKTLPDPAYLLKQTQLKPRMRSILVDWLVEMHQRFRLLPETLFLAINIMDRFMSVEVVQIDKLQLLATGSLFIAAKYEEVFSPSVKNYAYFTDGSYTEEEILEAEKYILTILNFDMNYPNPMNFLRRISKADDYDVQLRTLGKYLLEVTIVDHKFIGILPSLCSAAAMYIARLILKKDPVWNGNLIHYSGGYRVEDMRECIELIFNYLIGPIEHDEFYKKYSSRKFMKASLVCRSWAKKFVNERKDLFDPLLLTCNI